MLDLVISFIAMILIDRIAHRDMSLSQAKIEDDILKADGQQREALANQALVFEDRFQALHLELKDLRGDLHSSELREANIHAQLEIIDARFSGWDGLDQDD